MFFQQPAVPPPFLPCPLCERVTINMERAVIKPEEPLSSHIEWHTLGLACTI